MRQILLADAPATDGTPEVTNPFANLLVNIRRTWSHIHPFVGYHYPFRVDNRISARVYFPYQDYLIL